MTTDQNIRRVIAEADLHSDAVAAPELTPEDIHVFSVNEELESAAYPPQTDKEWLAWLAKRGVT